MSIVFNISADKWDTFLYAGFGLMKTGANSVDGDDEGTSKKLREEYGINEKLWSKNYLFYEFLTFDNKRINLINFNENCETYYELFDPIKFERIVDSTVEQAKAVFAKLR
jgi:hypothetical protein